MSKGLSANDIPIILRKGLEVSKWLETKGGKRFWLQHWHHNIVADAWTTLQWI